MLLAERIAARGRSASGPPCRRFAMAVGRVRDGRDGAFNEPERGLDRARGFEVSHRYQNEGVVRAGSWSPSIRLPGWFAILHAKNTLKSSLQLSNPKCQG